MQDTKNRINLKFLAYFSQKSLLLKLFHFKINIPLAKRNKVFQLVFVKPPLLCSHFIGISTIGTPFKKLQYINSTSKNPSSDGILGILFKTSLEIAFGAAFKSRAGILSIALTSIL